MTPLEEYGAVHTFEPSSSTWSLLTTKSGPYPQARSYHCATSTSTHLIIHAGCGTAGIRFNDVWAFDVQTGEWAKPPDAPGDPRGGSAITYAAGKIWRLGGYNGKTEVGGVIDCLALPSSISELAAAKWESRPFEASTDSTAKELDKGPGARSVCALLPLKGTEKLVTFLGEGRPSPTGGHDAAGNFWGDVWTYDPETDKWEAVDPSDRAGDGGHGPGERGWFAAASYDDDALLWGGIDGRNERLSDGWLLRYPS